MGKKRGAVKGKHDYSAIIPPSTPRLTIGATLAAEQHAPRWR